MSDYEKGGGGSLEGGDGGRKRGRGGEEKDLQVKGSKGKVCEGEEGGGRGGRRRRT